MPWSEMKDHLAEYRARAFWMRQVEETRILATVRDKVAEAMETGLDEESFVNAVTEAIGGDFTAARLRTVYRTNLQSAYSAGNWMQLQHPAVRDLFPYYQYVAIDDDRTRPEHALMDGKVFARDHKIWLVWWPPNGYNCRCTVIAIDKFEAEDMGRTKSDPWPTRGIAGPAVQPDDGFAGLPTDFDWKKHLAKAAKEAKAKAPRAPRKKKGELPDSLAGMTKVGTLPGSTLPELWQDASGKRYVLKWGAGEEHAVSEFQAEELYRKLGVAVPPSRLVEVERSGVKMKAKLSLYLDDLTPLNKLKGKAFDAAVAEAQKGFAADALLANWDVAGLDLDNLMVDKEGKVWRIDVGGALSRRAQGKPKPGWDAYPNELWTLRDKAINAQAAKIFGKLEWSEVVGQVNAVAAQKTKLLKGLPDDLKATLKARLETFEDVAQIHGTMAADQWKPEYLDSFLRHSVEFRKRGIVERLPKKMTARGVHLYDETGKVWDGLRGDESLLGQVKAYVEERGGSYQAVANFADQHSGSSYASGAQAAKWFYTRQRAVGDDAYWWKDGTEKATACLASTLKHLKTTEAAYTEAMTIWHAFNHEAFRTIKLPHSDPKAGTIRLIRTEAWTAMQAAGLQRGALKVTMKRGALDSTSLVRTVSIHGSETTVQEVPHHRVFGGWFMDIKAPGSGGAGFLSDGENEIVAMLEGIPFDYIRP